MKLLVGLLLFAAPLLPGEGSHTRALLRLESLLDDGQNAAAFEEYLRLEGEGVRLRAEMDGQRMFAARGFLDEAAEFLDRALRQDLERWRKPYVQAVRGDLHALAGEHEDALAAYDAAGDPIAAEHSAGLLVHLGRDADAVRTLEALYERWPATQHRHARMELALARGHADSAVALAEPPEGVRESSGGGNCALGMQAEQSRRATQLASVLLAAGRLAEARAVDPSWVDGAWFDLVAAPRDRSAKLAVIRRLLQLDPDGLPTLYPNEGEALARVAVADAFVAWETFAGRLGRVPGWPPSDGLRLTALARLLDVEGATELARSHLGGPDDRCALTLLALQRADGILPLLEERARGTLLDVDPARRESLVRTLTLHGTPESYASIRSLAAEAAPDVAREIRATLWDHPPWSSPTWRTDFLEDVP